MPNKAWNPHPINQHLPTHLNIYIKNQIYPLLSASLLTPTNPASILSISLLL